LNLKNSSFRARNHFELPLPQPDNAQASDATSTSQTSYASFIMRHLCVYVQSTRKF
jgi:hypothetical protein